jgi:hypothetical protein
MDIKEIEIAIAELPSSEVAKLAAWFEEFQAQAWDRQIARDLKAGKLDRLLREAEQDAEEGRCEQL